MLDLQQQTMAYYYPDRMLTVAILLGSLGRVMAHAN